MSKEECKEGHCRYYQIGGITIRLESEVPITDDTFKPKFRHFRVDGPGNDNITIRHHFRIPDLDDWELGETVYKNPPWTIYRNKGSWVYICSPPQKGRRIFCVAVFDHDYTNAEIYSVSATVDRCHKCLPSTRRSEKCRFIRHLPPW